MMALSKTLGNYLDPPLIDWLLEESNPSVRYFSLRDLLEKRSSDKELLEAKQAIPDSRVAKRILDKQDPDGFWYDPINPYIPKYKSLYWQIIILSQLGMSGDDWRIKKACEFAFKFQLEEGGFTASPTEIARKEYENWRGKQKNKPTMKCWANHTVKETELSCLTGNLVASFYRLGLGNDERIDKAISWLMDIQNNDGGWKCPYNRSHLKDHHACFYATACVMEAFSELPRNKRQKTRIKNIIEQGAEFLLMHRLFRADHHNYAVINPSWLELKFPSFWRYNILRGLDVLTKLGYTVDERLSDAIGILLDKRGEDGKWILEDSPGGMYATIETKGKPSKWITFYALRILKRLSERQE